ncbi:hypothetical protein E5288_WYG012542 [Bos mutus]|uniref:GPR128 N-terminal domain-containing protein n=1 Tax=Bos mutus TaxID=72004 RepID=A0A6B0R2P2_9CETA|nr:hypothetical protein [Bos mutus]
MRDLGKWQMHLPRRTERTEMYNHYCGNSAYRSFTCDRIPVGRCGSSLQTCDKNTQNGAKVAVTTVSQLLDASEDVLQGAAAANNDDIFTV